MPAPRDLEQLAAYVDSQLAELRLLLEQEHKAIFGIWAENNAPLVPLAFEWSFGDSGPAASGQGIVIPFRSSLIALSLSLKSNAAFDSNAFDTEAFDVLAFSFTDTVQAKVEIERDGTVESEYAVEVLSEGKAYQEFPTPLEFFAGSILNFRTFSQADTITGNRVCAWMRRE